MARYLRAVIAVAAAFLSACTLSETAAPPLQGPSELGLSLTIFANPDVITQNGTSQSLVVIQAFDANGLPARNIPLRAEITVGGVVSDFGTLSARTLVTGNDGRATVTFTAPPAPLVDTDTNLRVSIRVTPSGTNFADAEPRFVDIRLVPPGVIIGTGPSPSFTFTPDSPAIRTNVVFDATASTAPSNATIASYSWDFGDGGTGSGRIVTHEFRTPNTFSVTLTVTDSNGLSASTSRSITISPGTAPTADILFSPADPSPGETVRFTGEGSRAAPGRTIVRYNWRFGNGQFSTAKQPNTTYEEAGVYTVVLTVTDDAGQQGTASVQVTVQ